MEHGEERMVQRLLRQGLDPRSILNQVFAGRGYDRSDMNIFLENIIQMAETGFFNPRPATGWASLPTRQKAAILTASFTGLPLLARQLGEAGINFVSDLFGERGQRIQDEAVKDFEDLARTGRTGNPELNELASENPEYLNLLMERAQGGGLSDIPLIPEPYQAPLPQTPAPQFLPPNEFADARRQTMIDARQMAGEIIRGNPDMAPDDVIRAVKGYFGQAAEIFDINLNDLITELYLEGESGGSTYAESIPAFTEATNPDPRIRTESFQLQSFIDERNFDARQDAELGLRVGQKNQLENNIEKQPDYVLAGIQARRQALLRRPTIRTPMQMRDDGLVVVPYYSKLVQQ